MIKRFLNRATIACRLLSLIVLLMLIIAALYVLAYREGVNGGQALTLLLSVGAVIVAIGSMPLLRDE
jgi:hypothetical protein